MIFIFGQFLAQGHGHFNVLNIFSISYGCEHSNLISLFTYVSIYILIQNKKDDLSVRIILFEEDMLPKIFILNFAMASHPNYNQFACLLGAFFNTTLFCSTLQAWYFL